MPHPLVHKVACYVDQAAQKLHCQDECFFTFIHKFNQEEV